VTLDARAIGFVFEGSAGADAVLAGELFVAEADVGSDLRAFEAFGAFAEVEVRIVGFTIGDAATARAVDGFVVVTVGGPAALSADFGIDDRVGAGDAAGFFGLGGDFCLFIGVAQPVEVV